ncbi:MAG: putative quinol monooxygenase [Candidatus Berkiella sp.]
MSHTYFVISEWLPKASCFHDLVTIFKQLAAITLEKENGCLRYHVTQQIEHPGAQGQTQYPIVLIQEYASKEDFDKHCESDYVASFAEKYLLNEETKLIEDWRCRLLAAE